MVGGGGAKAQIIVHIVFICSFIVLVRCASHTDDAESHTELFKKRLITSA